jgi:hypothetical protein
MKKLRKLDYNSFFRNDFQLQKIDKEFKDLENKEKVRVLGSIIDLLYVDLKALKQKKKKKTNLSKEEILENRNKELGLHTSVQYKN